LDNSIGDHLVEAVDGSYVSTVFEMKISGNENCQESMAFLPGTVDELLLDKNSLCA